jgi:hypothetical protein
VDQVGSHNVGRYRGTQSFLFYLEPLATGVMAFASSPGSDVQAWLQFGREFGDPRLDFANEVPAGQTLDDLGYHLRINVDYTPLPVSEPSSWALLAAGLVFTTRALRRQRA